MTNQHSVVLSNDEIRLIARGLKSLAAGSREPNEEQAANDLAGLLSSHLLVPPTELVRPDGTVYQAQPRDERRAVRCMMFTVVERQGSVVLGGMPEGARPLHLAVVPGNPRMVALWVASWTTAKSVRRRFAIVEGEGFLDTKVHPDSYIGTVVLGGRFCHFFDQGEEDQTFLPR